MKINRYNWHKWAFAAWFVFCGLIGVALSVSAIIFLTSVAWGHEIEHTHPEAIPSPPPNEAIVKCLDEYDPFAHHNSTRRDQFEILKQCVINADKERQYQDAIKMFMAQRGVQM